MQIKSELKIREACRIVASGHKQWEQTGSIEPVHLSKMRKVQIDIAQHLAKFKDVSTRRRLRHIEQIASDLIFLSEQGATRRASGAECGVL